MHASDSCIADRSDSKPRRLLLTHERKPRTTECKHDIPPNVSGTPHTIASARKAAASCSPQHISHDIKIETLTKDHALKPRSTGGRARSSRIDGARAIESWSYCAEVRRSESSCSSIAAIICVTSVRKRCWSKRGCSRRRGFRRDVEERWN
jgi:hypothetical protein